MYRGSIVIPARRHRVPVLSARFRQWWDRRNSAFPTTSRDFSYLLGVLLGRFICGFLCPFGWFQELLHKIPTKKISTKKLKPLTYIKYAVLLFMVVLMPMLITNDVGMGDPFFCKYLCPQGVLEGAIPLAAVNSGIRAALGTLFSWKLGISDYSNRVECAFLPPVLQVAVSARRVLCTA